MEQLIQKLETLNQEIQTLSQQLKIGDQQTIIQKLKAEMAEPTFWQDNKHAQEISRQVSSLVSKVKPWHELTAAIGELQELIELGDSSLELELGAKLLNLESEFKILKKDLQFKGPYDDHDVILSIHAGAGGTDAQDWAEMLLRMYVRWAESHKLAIKTVELSAGEEAGIKSATIEITDGTYLFGKLLGEHGVHRLVRLSPFNSAASRETSFAKVEVLPMIDKPNEVEIDGKDLKVDVYRAGGHGGQSVNTTDSAVRITHLPTGITVAIQNERSQLQNRETAMTILRSKLAQLQIEQHAETLADVKGPNQSAEFGSQIRNYVLHPYKQVKDTRSGYESSDVQKVLDGELDPLINAWLATV